jgi:SAM-dependent methyltransferase
MNDEHPYGLDPRFGGSIPETYHSHLGPLLFQRYAEDLAGRVTLPRVPDARVLEVAAGTGILTAHIASRFSGTARITATDVSAPMLAVARRGMQQKGVEAAVDWSVADATALPFADAAFDAVVCQFGVMFFPDRERAALEAHRVLRAGGQWLFSVWGSWDENPFGQLLHDTVNRFFPDDPLGSRLGPFSFHDPVALHDLVTGAGFQEPDIITLDMELETESAERAAIGFVRGNPLINAIEKRGAARPEMVIRAVADALARNFGDHPLRVPARARVVSARR